MKPRTFKPILASATVGMLLGTSAFGVIQTVNVELDLADLQPGLSGFTAGVQGAPPFSPAFSVDLAEGDQFDFTLRFKNSQTLTINGLSLIWLFSYASADPSDVEGTGTLSFLDTAGSVLFSSDLKTSTEQAIHFGQFFYSPSDFPGISDPITFGGLRYSGVVDDYAEPGITVRTYNSPALYFNAQGYQTGRVPDVGTSMTLLGLGIAPIIALRRRSLR
jgi:hypothetical protein